MLLKVFGEIDFLLFANRLLNIGELLLHVSHQHIHQIEKTIQGLYDALAGRLSPKLIDLATLEAAIQNLEARAGRQRFDLITNSVAHIFEMPTSLYAESGVVDVITHIPTVSSPSKLDLYTIEPIPFVLSLPVKKVESKNYAWAVDYDQKVVVTNQDRSVAYEIEESQMDDCTVLGTTCCCRQIVQRKVTTISSCGLAIFREQLHLVHQLCRIRVMKVTEVAVAIYRYQTILFSRRQKLFIVCREPISEKSEMQPTVEGLVILSILKEKDRMVLTLAHQWRRCRISKRNTDTAISRLTSGQSRCSTSP